MQTDSRRIYGAKVNLGNARKRRDKKAIQHWTEVLNRLKREDRIQRGWTPPKETSRAKKKQEKKEKKAFWKKVRRVPPKPAEPVSEPVKEPVKKTAKKTTAKKTATKKTATKKATTKKVAKKKVA